MITGATRLLGLIADPVLQSRSPVRVAIGDAADRRYDLAVNATSLGMRAGDELPLSHDQIERAQLVAECVVAPPS